MLITLLEILIFIFGTLLFALCFLAVFGIIASVYQFVYEYFFCVTKTVLTPTGLSLDNLVEEHIYNKKTGKLVRIQPVDNTKYQ